MTFKLLVESHSSYFVNQYDIAILDPIVKMCIEVLQNYLVGHTLATQIKLLAIWLLALVKKNFILVT